MLTARRLGEASLVEAKPTKKIIKNHGSSFPITHPRPEVVLVDLNRLWRLRHNTADAAVHNRVCDSVWLNFTKFGT